MILKWEKVIEGKVKFHIAAASDKENSFEEFHGHDFYEILYLEKGSFIHNINNENIIINAGELLFISPQDKHQIKKMNNKAKGYRRCFGFLAEDGTCTKPESTTT